MKMIEEVIHKISDEFTNVIYNKYEYFSECDIVISSEQQFYSSKERSPGRIYIVVKFGEASLDYGQTTLPLTIQIISEQNNLEVCQTLLYEFANKYNLYFEVDKEKGISTKQLYNAPYVLSNFNEVFEGFRSLMYISGVFLFTRNANYFDVYYSSNELTEEDEIENVSATYYYKTPIWKTADIEVNLKYFVDKVKPKEDTEITFVYNEEYKNWYNDTDKIIENNIQQYGIELLLEEPKEGDKIIISYKSGWKYIESISTNFVCDINLDSQAFYDTNGFTTSRAKFASRSFNITSYLFDDDFYNKCINISLEQLKNESKGIDTAFRLLLHFSNGIKLAKDFRMASISMQQPLKELPVISVTFTN